MKITLDLAELVSTGALTAAEAERLKKLAAQGTGSAAANILIAFGIVAVALGATALLPSAETACVIGAFLLALGVGLSLTETRAWLLLARIMITVGGLVLAAGLFVLSELLLPEREEIVMFALAVGFASLAVVAHSGLLAAISVLTLAAALGAAAGYRHAVYTLGISEPTLTIAAFSVLALFLLFSSFRLPPVYQRLAIIAARTAVLVVNLAFLVGSLWGDELPGEGAPRISEAAFSITWAVLLLAVGAWAVRAGRRWVVNVAAVFAAIHFYTQWFQSLGASPVSILGGGVLLVAFGLGLVTFNQRRGAAAGPARPA